jgi:hypothetical protein
MDAKVERPDARRFTFNPREVARERRVEFVTAGLTVLRAYVAAGRPIRLTPFGSFEEWDLIRGALVWVEREDPERTRAEVLAADPRKSDLIELLVAWRACFKDQEKTLNDVRAHCEVDRADHDRLRLMNLLIDLTGRTGFNAKSIGRHLKRFLDRVVHGMALRKRDTNVGAVWWVEASGDQKGLAYIGP